MGASNGGCVMLWSLDLEASSGTMMDLCFACWNFLCCVEIFRLKLRTKFGSDIMLNISIDAYTMLHMLQYIWKR